MYLVLFICFSKLVMEGQGLVIEGQGQGYKFF